MSEDRKKKDAYDWYVSHGVRTRLVSLGKSKRHRASGIQAPTNLTAANTSLDTQGGTLRPEENVNELKAHWLQNTDWSLIYPRRPPVITDASGVSPSSFAAKDSRSETTNEWKPDWSDWSERGQLSACRLLDSIMRNVLGEPLLPFVLSKLIVEYSELAFHCVLYEYWCASYRAPRLAHCSDENATEKVDDPTLDLIDANTPSTLHEPTTGPSDGRLVEYEDETLCPVLTYFDLHLHTPQAQEAIVLLLTLLSRYFPVRVQCVRRAYDKWCLESTSRQRRESPRWTGSLSVQPPDPDSMYGAPGGCGDRLFQLRYGITRDGYSPSLLELTTRLGAAFWRVPPTPTPAPLPSPRPPPLTCTPLPAKPFALAQTFTDEQEIVFGRAIESGNLVLVQHILQTPLSQSLVHLGFVLDPIDFHWAARINFSDANRPCRVLVRKYLENELINYTHSPLARSSILFCLQSHPFALSVPSPALRP